MLNKYEEHGSEFLDYVAKNKKHLEKAIKKNITLDVELFDDVFSDTIVKVYDHIVKNEQMIDDFKNFFFISAKWNYINAQNKQRKRNETKDNQLLYDEEIQEIYTAKVECANYQEKEEKLNRMGDYFKWLTEYLEQQFEPSEVSLFLIYFKLKSQNRKVSYKRLAEITQTSFNQVALAIQKLKTFVRNDKTCLEKLNEMKEENSND